MKNKIIAVAIAVATSVLFTISSHAQGLSQSQINAMQAAMNRAAMQAAADRIQGNSRGSSTMIQLTAEAQSMQFLSNIAASSVRQRGQALETIARKK